MTPVLMLKDLEDAEARYTQCAAELRRYQRDPDGWLGTHEELTNGRRVLVHADDSHFQKLDQLRGRLERAHRSLVAVRQAWLRGE